MPVPQATMTVTKATGGTAAKSTPSSLVSGKVLGLNLAAFNPWLLLGIGAIGGYYYCRKKRFSFF